MTALVVRHAEPAVSPALDPRAWPLSEAGRNAASQLGQRLPRSGRWVSSTERKAYETLLCAAGDSSVAVASEPASNTVVIHRDQAHARHDVVLVDWEEPVAAAAQSYATA